MSQTIFSLLMGFAAMVVEVEDMEYRRKPQVSVVECALY